MTKFPRLHCVFEYSGRDCPEFLQRPRPQERTAENAFDVHPCSFTCLHSLSFLRPISAFERDVAHRLPAVSAVAFVRIGFVDRVQVRAEVDLAIGHLCNHRADRSVSPAMCVEYVFAGLAAVPALAVFLGVSLEV